VRVCVRFSFLNKQ